MDQVDASLLGLSVPYRVLSPEDPVMRRTVERIEEDLHCRGGGVDHYVDDTYCGGGEWVLLAAWLGWYYAEAGERDNARELQRWIEAQADAMAAFPNRFRRTSLLLSIMVRGWRAGGLWPSGSFGLTLYLILRHALDYPED